MKKVIHTHELVREFRNQGHFGSAYEAISDPLVRRVLEMAAIAKSDRQQEMPAAIDLKMACANDRS